MADWDWYLAKRRGESTPIIADDPRAGFFRKPKKEYYGGRRTFMPVAYYPLDGALHCREGDKDVSTERGLELWHWVADHDRDQKEWRRVAEEGGLWDDEHPLVPMQGDNRPPEPNTFEELRDEIEDLAHEAAERIEGAPIADQPEADRIANLADRLAELWKRAKSRRDEERKPYDELVIGIQKKWTPLLVAAEAYKNLKYKLLTPWAAKERARKKEAAEAAAAAGQPAAAETRRTRMGTRGRAMTERTIKRAEIVDYDACREFFKDAPDMREVVQQLANRMVRTGLNVPGTKVIEETQVV